MGPAYISPPNQSCPQRGLQAESQRMIRLVKNKRTLWPAIVIVALQGSAERRTGFVSSSRLNAFSFVRR